MIDREQIYKWWEIMQDIDLIAKLQEQCDRIEAEYKQHLARKKSAYAKKKQAKTK